jgi:hypothetical protein
MTMFASRSKASLSESALVEEILALARRGLTGPMLLRCYRDQPISNHFRLTAKVCVSPLDVEKGKVILSQIFEFCAMFYDVKQRFCNAVSNRYDGFFGSQAGLKAEILVPVIGMFTFDCGPGGLDEHGLDHLFADGTSCALSFPCAFVISRAYSTPRTECFNSTERGKVGAYLSKNGPGIDICDSRDLIQSLGQIVVLGKQSFEAVVYQINLVLQSAYHCQRRLQKLAFMDCEVPLNCIVELQGFLLLVLSGQIPSQAFLHVAEGNGRILKQQSDEIAACDSEQITEHRVNLDVCHFQHLVEPSLVVTQVVDETLAQAAPITPLSDLLARDEAPPHQPMPQQTRKPFAIGHIGLATGQMFGVACVDKNHLNEPFQDVEDGAPVDACTLYSNDGTFAIEQPLFQGPQLTGESAKFAVLNVFTCGCLRDQTRGHRLFVNVQTAANWMQYFQHSGIFFSGHGNLRFYMFSLLRMPWLFLQSIFMFRCDQMIMVVRRNGGTEAGGYPAVG